MVLELDPPLRGPWRALHSPTSRVPSHGTTMLALSHALDLLPVDERGRTAPIGLRALLGTEGPEIFPGFGREVLAPSWGRVVSAVDGAEDHAAHRGLSSVGYALTQRGGCARDGRRWPGTTWSSRSTGPARRGSSRCATCGGGASPCDPGTRCAPERCWVAAVTRATARSPMCTSR